MEENDHLSEENNQPANKIGIFKTSDYDLNRGQRKAKYEDYDYVLCEKCDQEISKFYCKHCYNEETDVYKRIHIKYGKSKIGIFKILVYALDWKQRRAKYKDLCEKCNQEINKWYFYCKYCYEK